MYATWRLPKLCPAALFFQQQCAEEGIDIIFTSTYRDIESQNELYAQGRTKPGRIVTDARGGDSFHNYRVAFDVVPVVNGKAVWDDKLLWERIGGIGRICGLEWGGSWKGFKDRPHFQDTNGFTIADYKAGRTS
jgi:peptidoglycan L-alanyl-D-glutamate endopeptidase CwlK